MAEAGEQLLDALGDRLTLEGSGGWPRGADPGSDRLTDDLGLGASRGCRLHLEGPLTRQAVASSERLGDAFRGQAEPFYCSPGDLILAGCGCVPVNPADNVRAQEEVQ